jgi:hypothetical protein
MTKKIEEFLGAPLTLPEAVVGHLLFTAYEKPPHPPLPAHIGKFGEAICFTIEELRCVIKSAETFLTTNMPSNKGEENAIAFYFLINPTRGKPDNHGKPSIMLVGSKMKEMPSGKIELRNIIKDAIRKLPEDLLNNPIENKKEIASAIEKLNLASYDEDLYDMGDRHP